MADELTFKELRDKSLRYLSDKSFVYSGSCTILNPDPDWIKEEFLNLRDDLASRSVNHSFRDLVNAFYSAAYELEYGKTFYPNSLIQIPGYDIARLIEFRVAYPVQIVAVPYVRKKMGTLHNFSCTVLLTECKLIAKQDSLAKQQHG